jgi:hypothetical protein
LELILDESLHKLTIAPLSTLPPTHGNRRATDPKG